jgi:hypothetical protein
MWQGATTGTCAKYLPPGDRIWSRVRDSTPVRLCARAHRRVVDSVASIAELVPPPQMVEQRRLGRG